MGSVTTGHVAPTELTCITGTVNIEPESGIIVFDDTKETTCGFGQTKCYKRTTVARFGNWPGILN